MHELPWPINPATVVRPNYINPRVMATSGDRSELGELGEAIVARWLQQQGFEILERRWRCRWGELDLIAGNGAELHFAEVKTRSVGNWDAGGLLAISTRKQDCLYKSAMAFLRDRPTLAEFPCSFYLARVGGRKLAASKALTEEAIVLGQSACMGRWELTLLDYGAIELEI